MSRIETAEMFLRLKNYLSTDDLQSSIRVYNDYNLFVYAPCYNVLRFMSGMASLVFSN